MQSLYKIKTAKFFEKVKKKDAEVNLDEEPFSITNITLCTESRLLAIGEKNFCFKIFTTRWHSPNTVPMPLKAAVSIQEIFFEPLHHGAFHYILSIFTVCD